MDDLDVTNLPMLSDANPAPSAEPEVTQQLEADNLDLDPAALDGQADSDDEDYEHEGKKYRIHKDLKPFLLRQGDYTKKTQEVADTRRGLEARQTQIAEAEASFQEHVKEVAELHHLGSRLEQYQQIDWMALADQDPAKFNKLRMQYDLEKESYERKSAELEGKVRDRQTKARDAETKAVEECNKQLATRIPNWSDKLGTEIGDYAIKTGLIAEHQRSKITSPAHVEAIYKAMMFDRLVEQQRARAKKTEQEATTESKPVTQVGTRRAAPAFDVNSPKTDIKTWMKEREKQVAAKR